jgi:hypothetical protein
MRVQWVRVSGAALILSVTIAACGGDRATGVQPVPVTGVQPVSVALKKMKMQSLPDTVTVATRLVPLEQALTASAVIGPAGGTLQLPEAGLRVIVPRNAVATDVTFTVKALPGAMLAYEFGPHGTVFNTPLRVEQDIKGVLLPADENVVAGYFPEQDDLLVDEVVGTINEKLPAQLDVAGAKVRFDVSHFSGYLIATGRQ